MFYCVESLLLHWFNRIQTVCARRESVPRNTCFCDLASRSPSLLLLVTLWSDMHRYHPFLPIRVFSSLHLPTHLQPRGTDSPSGDRCPCECECATLLNTRSPNINDPPSISFTLYMCIYVRVSLTCTCR